MWHLYTVVITIPTLIPIPGWQAALNTQEILGCCNIKFLVLFWCLLYYIWMNEWTDTSLRYRHWRMCFERLLQAFARWQPGNLFDIAAQPILEYRWIDRYTQLSLRTQFKVATVYLIHTQSLSWCSTRLVPNMTPHWQSRLPTDILDSSRPELGSRGQLTPISSPGWQACMLTTFDTQKILSYRDCNCIPLLKYISTKMITFKGIFLVSGYMDVNTPVYCINWKTSVFIVMIIWSDLWFWGKLLVSKARY